MTRKNLTLGSLIAAVAATLAIAGPAAAQSHGGGGGHAGGGGHSFGGGHAAVAHAGFAGHAGGFSGGARGFAGVQHFGPGGHVGFSGAAGYSHAGYYHGGGYYGGHGFGGYWGGGYWHGGYWPRAWYGPGFAWFLPVLPLAYATYWWDGLPYYYANDVYYTWSPSYDGYVATDPPPVNADPSGSGAIVADGRPTDPSQAAQGQMAGAGGGQVFMYPKNGQSEAQQATDRTECQRWAGSQASGASPDDYRRAMAACAEARGYSVK
jgi:hypothetical protein